MRNDCKNFGLVNIKSLKVFAAKLSESVLKDLLLIETDVLDTNEFLVKVDVWLKLIGRR